MQNLSAVVDEALEIHIERLARQAALRELLDNLEPQQRPRSRVGAGRRAGRLRPIGRAHRRPLDGVTLPVVLDADELDALTDSAPPKAFRALLREALERGRDVLVPAVVCAERVVDRPGPAASRRRWRATAWPAVNVRRSPLSTPISCSPDRLARCFTGPAPVRQSRRRARRSSTRSPRRQPGDHVGSDGHARLAATVPAARVITRPAR